ncbi:MAG: methionine biosynthesis protein MetW [Spirochaetota bacterium]
MAMNDSAGYDLILGEIPERARVLDLGCGDGELLYRLYLDKHIEPHGVEILQSNVAECVKKGLYVSHGDIDEGLSNYRDNSFDYVILNQTLQNTKKPGYVLREIMRIGKNAIVSFPNFVYIHIRLQMMFTGAMPTTKALPFAWDESPNIHLVSIKDFKHYCGKKGYPVKKELHFSSREDGSSRIKKAIPNLFAEYGFFILDGSSYHPEKK